MTPDTRTRLESVGMRRSNSLKSGQKHGNCGKLAAMKTTSKGGKVRSSSAPGTKKVLVLHGPNLNLLGTREPQIYGGQTLKDIDARLEAQAAAAGIKLDSFQSNSEAELIERIHEARLIGVDFILINPA